MKKVHIFLESLFLLLYPLVASSGEISERILSAADIKIIQNETTSHNYLAVNFSQNTFKNMRKNTIYSSGYVIFSRPNRFRWVIEKPNPQQWLFDGKDLYDFRPIQKEAIKYSALATKSKDFNMIVEMILDFKMLEKRYSFTRAVEVAGEILMDLTPKYNSDVEKVSLVYSLKIKSVASIKLYTRGNNHTLFSFTQSKSSKLLAEKFTLPTGTKISSGI